MIECKTDRQSGQMDETGPTIFLRYDSSGDLRSPPALKLTVRVSRFDGSVSVVDAGKSMRGCLSAKRSRPSLQLDKVRTHRVRDLREKWDRQWGSWCGLVVSDLKVCILPQRSSFHIHHTNNLHTAAYRQ